MIHLSPAECPAAFEVHTACPGRFAVFFFLGWSLFDENELARNHVRSRCGCRDACGIAHACILLNALEF